MGRWPAGAGVLRAQVRSSHLTDEESEAGGFGDLHGSPSWRWRCLYLVT